MHEDLLGYLLGALEPHEMRRVGEWLKKDPEARRQLDEIEKSLKPLEESFQPSEPPPADLVARTLANLPPMPHSGDQSAQESSIGESGDQAMVELASMNRGVDSPPDSAIRWLDWVGGIATAVVILGLLLPILAESRAESRKVACQDQMRQLGTSITQYVTRNSQERLPLVAESGREAFAGIYANRLYDMGLLTSPWMRWCPSMDRPAAEDYKLVNLNSVTPVAELHTVSINRLSEIQQVSGGHYAYTLGVVDHDHYTSPRFEGRSSFAVLSDAPFMNTNSPTEFRVLSHNGEGINVLYEDGRVRFISITAIDSMRDHIWQNHHGSAEAGVNVDDASLAPSGQPPFVTVNQR
ncbi:MAG: hypothetical protein GY904_08150 [Planctomycetaceae bacterium]|nr:hypothetical protein [Planctomycetaceae bacterium]